MNLAGGATDQVHLGPCLELEESRAHPLPPCTIHRKDDFAGTQLCRNQFHCTCKVCLISPGTDLPGEWALLALGSFPGLLRQTLSIAVDVLLLVHLIMVSDGSIHMSYEVSILLIYRTCGSLALKKPPRSRAAMSASRNIPIRAAAPGMAPTANDGPSGRLMFSTIPPSTSELYITIILKFIFLGLIIM